MFEYPPKVAADTFPEITYTDPPEERSQEEERTLVGTLSGDGSAVGVLALPKTGTYGVTKLCLIAGDLCSPSVNESQTPPEEVAPFHVAPGLDALAIGWNTPGPREARKVTFELFSARTKDTPIARAEWELDPKKASPLEKDADEKLGCSGTTAWTKDLFTFDDAVKDDFPDGLPTVKHSPYQLRMTVEKNESSQLPGYPLVAWTTFHVAVDSIALAWGPDDALPDKPNACEPEHEGTWAAREKAMMAALRQGSADPTKGLNRVVMEATLTSGEGAKVFADDYAALWGRGPRIPLIATPLVRRANGKKEPDPKALAGLQVLWDWCAPEEHGWQHWLGREPGDQSDAWKATSTAADRAFFTRLFEKLDQDRDATLSPKLAHNCPSKLGGRQTYGSNDEVHHFFLCNGPAPYEGDVLGHGSNRQWAMLGKVSADPASAGQSGVLFAPGRIPGDYYEVTAFLALPGGDGKLELDVKDDALGGESLRAHAERGGLPTATAAFRLYRKMKVTYCPIPSTVPTDWIDKTKAYYERAAGVVLDVTTVTPDRLPGQFRAADRYKAAYEAMYRTETNEDVEVDGAKVKRSLQLGAWHAIASPDKADLNDPRMHIPTRDLRGYKAALEETFKGAKVWGLDLSGPLVAGNPEVKAGGAEGWLLGKAPFGGEHTYLVLSKNGQAFAKDATIEVPSFTYDKATKKLQPGAPAATATIKAVRTKASGWLQRQTKLKAADDDATVKVTFGTQAVTVSYAKKGVLKKTRSTSLPEQGRADLERTFVTAAHGHDPARPLVITIEGKTTSKDDQRRVAGVRSYIHGLLEDGTVLDTYEVFGSVLAAPTTYATPEEYLPKFDKQAKFVWDELRKEWQTGDLGAEQGVIYLCYERQSHGTSIPGGASFTGDNKATLAVAYSTNPGRHQGPKQQYVEPIPLLIHEIGHAFYLGHASARQFSTKDPTELKEELGAHVGLSTCVMNYDVDPLSVTLCAMCLLKLRGWDMKQVDRLQHLALDPSGLSEDQAIDEQLKLLDEDAKHLPAPAWIELGAAFLMSKKKDVVDARKKVEKEAEDEKFSYRKQWADYGRYRDLKGKNDKSSSERKEFARLEKKAAEEEARSARASSKIRIEARELRAKAAAFVARVDKAAELYKATDATYGTPLGIVMLRELCLVHFRFGDVARGHEYLKLLLDRTSHPQDVGTLKYTVEDGKQVVSYDPGSPRSLGACLQGLETYEYRLTLELGDVNDLFRSAGTTDPGRMERLQVLGLLNRPLKHPTAGDAFRFCWEYAKRLLPGIDADPTVFERTLREYLVSGGALPGPGEFAKVRRHGGFTVNYSQTAMMLRFPEEDFPKAKGYQEGKHPAEVPYASYMLGAERAAVEDAFCDDNPAIGKVPLRIKVERRPVGAADDAWVKAPKGSRVYVELVAPDPLPDHQQKGADQARHALAGGHSHHDQAVAPPLQQKPADYLKAKVAGFHPATNQADPQAKNAHFILGGKRDLSPSDVSSSFLTIPNVFCDTGKRAFGSLPQAGSGVARDHTVCLDTDAEGVVNLTFAPSRVGGDAYRLRAYVGPPTRDVASGDDVGVYKAETGTMVTWRTVRVCKHVRMEGAATKGDLPAYLQKEGVPDKLTADLGDLPAVDLKGAVTTELARAYCELIVDPDAATPTSVSACGPDLLQTAKDMAGRHKTLNRPALAKNASIFRDPLPPAQGDQTGTRFEVTLSGLPDPGTLTIRPKGGGKSDAVASDEDKSGTLGALKGVKAGRVDYGAGKVTVEFDAAQDGKEYDVAYFPRSYIDLDSLLTFPAKSPYLFNLVLPADYNAAIQGKRFRPMELDGAGKPTNAHIYIDDRASGLCKNWLMEALTLAIDRSQGFYPGLVIIQALSLDSYTGGVWKSGTQEGKAVGNGVYLFGKASDKWNQLTVHEVSHGLYLQHAPTASGAKAELHDPADTCVMSYSANDGDFCGQCNASLRGLHVEHSPFVAEE